MHWLLYKRSWLLVILLSCLFFTLDGCRYQPPYNNFKPYKRLKDSKKNIIQQLQKRQIQILQYGDTVTIVVPTDRYFLFNSPRLSPLCFSGFALLIKLIKLLPTQCPIYIAGFTNAVGSNHHKQALSQAQAEAMLTFLWANGIPTSRLNAEGYGDKYPLSDNQLIHGSAQNRRLEIQILYSCTPNAVSIMRYEYIK